MYYLDFAATEATKEIIFNLLRNLTESSILPKNRDGKLNHSLRDKNMNL